MHRIGVFFSLAGALALAPLAHAQAPEDDEAAAAAGDEAGAQATDAAAAPDPEAGDVEADDAWADDAEEGDAWADEEDDPWADDGGDDDWSDEEAFDEDDPWAEVEAPGDEEEEEEFGGPPINFALSGYFRTRLHHYQNVPVRDPGDPNLSLASNAGFGTMRARFNPTISYGDPENPDAALKMQIDVLDNVVFGDNSRIIGTPLFAENPSNTFLVGQNNLFGQEGDAVFIRRLWLELNVLIGQLRIGRQGSQGGLGILFNDGNGFRNDFGDALQGTTFDRILFVTRPITVANAISGKGADPTPLVFGVGHDWLVEDPVLQRSRLPTYTPPTADPETGGTPPTAAIPFPPESYRSPFPYGFLANGGDDIGQAFAVLAWLDPDFNADVSPDDELRIGTVWLYRYQNSTDSDIFIADAFYRLKWHWSEDSDWWLYSESEVYSISGTSNAVPLTGDYDEELGRTETRLGANIWGGAFRLGVEDPMWSFIAEAGFSSGQPGQEFASINQFDQRANNPNYQVGLLLYPVAIASRTAQTYGTTFATIWSRGGVWNSRYLVPQVRLRPFAGVELILQGVLAWAGELNTPLVNGRDDPSDTSCGLEGECFLGWEVDVAVKVNAGEEDNIRWSTEFGVMGAGDALSGEVDRFGEATPRGLTEAFLWTLQSRVAFLF